MKIAITGSDGLLGWHSRAYLKTYYPDYQVVLINRSVFSDAKMLAGALASVEVIFHFAGMNRGDEAQIEATNSKLAQRLTSACEAAGVRPHIIYANSTHSTRDTAYGRGKKQAAQIISAWADKNTALFSDVVLPHVFGEFGKPFYNSVVSTFCHQLAQGETPTITTDGELQLMHVQDVAALFSEIAHSGTAYGKTPQPVVPMRVSELLEKLSALHQSYRAGIMPSLASPIDLHLFNTLRSYLFPGHYPVALTQHSDARGALVEVIKANNGGQMFISTTHPGITRGNHYHTRKVERFFVASGEAVIRLRKLFSDEILSFPVSGDAPCYIDMPTFYTHDITNTGTSPLVTVFWANEIFDPVAPDTFAEKVAS